MKIRKSKTFLVGSLIISALALLVLTPLSVSAAPPSGGANIGLVSTPEHPVAGEETHFVITVKDNNQQPVANAKVSVRAAMVMAQGSMPGMNHGGGAGSNGSQTVTAKPSAKPGEYLATLKLTDVGEWQFTVTSDASTAAFNVTAVKAEAGGHAGSVTSPTGASDGHSASTQGGPNWTIIGGFLAILALAIAAATIFKPRSATVVSTGRADPDAKSVDL